jgi:peptidoglycan/xylan/chitin deacetylase (PgdA/CDA1 family)
VGLHTFDHVRWQDYVAEAGAAWTRRELDRGVEAFAQVFGSAPTSHAAAGWQINAYALELEREYGFKFASDTRGRTPFWPVLPQGGGTCLQLPTTLPTFDELLGLHGVNESNIAERVFELSSRAAAEVQVFTLHAELEGMRLLDAFDALLARWRSAGARLGGMGELYAEIQNDPQPHQRVQMGEVAGRSGLLAVQA